MKKLLIFLILAYLSFTINSSGAIEEEEKIENEKTLKIGVLLPLSGEFQEIGESFLKAIQLALYDISNENVIIYPKDSKGNGLNSYLSAKKFEEEGVHDNLCRALIMTGPITGTGPPSDAWANWRQSKPVHREPSL